MDVEKFMLELAAISSGSRIKKATTILKVDGNKK
jgi:hypothetical protein